MIKKKRASLPLRSVMCDSLHLNMTRNESSFNISIKSVEKLCCSSLACHSTKNHKNLQRKKFTDMKTRHHLYSRFLWVMNYFVSLLSSRKNDHDPTSLGTGILSLKSVCIVKNYHFCFEIAIRCDKQDFFGEYIL